MKDSGHEGTSSGHRDSGKMLAIDQPAQRVGRATVSVSINAAGIALFARFTRLASAAVRKIMR